MDAQLIKREDINVTNFPLEKSTCEDASGAVLCDTEIKTEQFDVDNESGIHSTSSSEHNYPTIHSSFEINESKKVNQVCKYCHEKFTTKEMLWEHTKVHIPKEKLHQCIYCPFVTDVKQHFNYHVNTHIGVNPFKCNQCSYSCVTKSMLLSHMKCHENFYQFTCSTCNYMTKYGHSFRKHLKKYNHQGNKVSKQTGQISKYNINVPLKRGRKKHIENEEELKSQSSNLHETNFNQSQVNMPLHPLHLQYMIQLELIRKQMELRGLLPREAEDESQLLDKSEDEDSKMMTPEVVMNMDEEITVPEKKTCLYCDITYGSDILYMMHMSFHDDELPFRCKKCDLNLSDKIRFNLHIIDGKH